MTVSITYDPTQFKCPKCGGELSDWWDGEPVSAFVGEWSEDRFRCEGTIIETDPCVSTVRRPVVISVWKR